MKKPSVEENASPGEEAIVALLRYGRVACILRGARIQVVLMHLSLRAHVSNLSFRAWPYQTEIATSLRSSR